jgi:hypothetical protein
MHLNFAFTAHQILWTLAFAAQLVLLVVLSGRERSRLFPWFTASIFLSTLHLLVEELLTGRMPVFKLQWILIPMSDLSALLGILVVVEIARRSFPGARGKAWLIAAPLLTLLAGLSLTYWGPWPARADLVVNSPISLLRLLFFFGEKVNILASLLIVGLGLLVLFFGRCFNTGWRKHSSLILIGLVAIALTWLCILAYWKNLSLTILPNMTREQYQLAQGHIQEIGKKLFDGNRIVGIVVALWWVVSLWIDEPGIAASGNATEAELLPEISAVSASESPTEE